MLNKELIQEQIKASYQTLDRVYDQRHSIKKWALTVWAALIIGILSDKIEMSFCEALITIVTVLIGFWVYDGMIASYGVSITPCVSIDVASTENYFGALRQRKWDILSS